MYPKTIHHCVSKKVTFSNTGLPCDGMCLPTKYYTKAREWCIEGVRQVTHGQQ